MKVERPFWVRVKGFVGRVACLFGNHDTRGQISLVQKCKKCGKHRIIGNYFEGQSDVWV